jgi:hypothetical protein
MVSVTFRPPLTPGNPSPLRRLDRRDCTLVIDMKVKIKMSMFLTEQAGIAVTL